MDMNIKKYGDEELYNNLNDVKKELDYAYNNFEFAYTKEIIDYYIYEIKACEAKYNNILKQIKKNTKEEIVIIDKAG